MPRLVNRNPSYRHHKPSGRAVVTVNGEDVYLGAYGSKESRREYDRVMGEWLARGRQAPGADDLRRIADVILAYWSHAKTYYAGEQGRAELESIKLALSILRRAYGDSAARDFGPLALQVVREKMVDAGWSRRYVNAQVGRIKRMFKWACSRELVAPSLFHGLQAVEGLRKGKTEAVELEPVKPVPEERVYAIKDHVSRQVWGMIRLQLFSGMRPGEVCLMRGCDIDTTGKVWTYVPERHKTAHRGHQRVIYLGPQARAVVEEFLKPDTQAYLFSPAEAEAERRAEMHEARKLNGTPLSCGNLPGSNVARKPGRKPKGRYTVTSYRRAIARACDQAFPPAAELARRRVPGNKTNAQRWETVKEWRERLGKTKWAELQASLAENRWHPHQIRHSAATRLRKQYGLEAARVVLGHRSAAVAEVYAEIDRDKARQIMGEVG